MHFRELVPLPLVLAALVAAIFGCGSKSALVVGDVSDTGVVDVGSVDTSRPDGGFDTFPCSWSYSRPLEIGRGVDFGLLQGAVHGRNDVVWVHAEDRASPDGRISSLVALGDPPRIIDQAPNVTRNGRVHGLVDGWVMQAEDCSLSFFDDEARPLRLVVPPVAEPPCFLERVDASFIDLISMSIPVTVHRLGTRGREVHSFSTEFGGYSHATVSPDGTRAVVTSQSLGVSPVAALYETRSGSLLATSDLEGFRIPHSLGVDRTRPAALALFTTESFEPTLVRLAFDEAEFAPRPFVAEGTPLLGQAEGALAVNETEGLFPLEDGRVLAQPLSGTGPRFLETPATGVEKITVLLAPGQSRGGVFYAHPAASGATVLSFRTLTCNR